GTSAAAKEATASDLLTLWEGQKMTAAETSSALQALGYPAAEAQRKMDVVDARKVIAAEQKFITDLAKAVVGNAITDAQAVAQLGKTSVRADGQQRVLGWWRDDRELQQIPPPKT